MFFYAALYFVDKNWYVEVKSFLTFFDYIPSPSLSYFPPSLHFPSLPNLSFSLPVPSPLLSLLILPSPCLVFRFPFYLNLSPPYFSFLFLFPTFPLLYFSSSLDFLFLTFPLPFICFSLHFLFLTFPPFLFPTFPLSPVPTFPLFFSFYFNFSFSFPSPLF